MTAASAETIALKGLGFLLDSPDSLNRFLDMSGIQAGTLRQRAADPEFLAAVVDFLLSEDALLTQFCESESLETRILHLVRRELPGG